MPEKDANNAEWIVQAVPFIFAIFLSCLGGLVSHLNRMDKHGLAFNFFRLFIDIVTSGFVGIISFMLCDAAEFGWSYTAAIVAISGHMGTRALFLFEIAVRYFYLYLGDTDMKTAKQKLAEKKTPPKMPVSPMKGKMPSMPKGKCK